MLRGIEQRLERLFEGVFGRAFDATGSYSSLLLLLAAALGIMALTNFLLPRYSDASTN